VEGEWDRGFGSDIVLCCVEGVGFVYTGMRCVETWSFCTEN
jgi:hypothetical protein